MFENFVTIMRDMLVHALGVIRTMTFVDYIEILVLTLIVYVIIRFVRETRAAQLLKGIFFIFIISLLLQQVDFKVLGVLGETIVNVGVIAAIVMFQPELRRVLEKMGRAQIVKSIAMNFEGEPYKLTTFIEQISRSCESLSHKAIGALIVIERETKLGEQIATGTILSAIPSEELFGNIFHPHTPLHDGAVIIRDGMILAAGCFLPKPQKEELISKDLGSRHRAAIGITEISDAVVIIVSEETGIISIAENGEIQRGFNYQKLHDYLTQALMPSKREKKTRQKKAKADTQISDKTDNEAGS